MIEGRSNPRRTRALVELATGVGLVLFGIIATAVTYNEAVEAGGGTYLIVYGPIVGGMIALVRGVIDLFYVDRFQDQGFGWRKRSPHEVVTLSLVVGSVLTVLAIIVAVTTFGTR